MVETLTLTLLTPERKLVDRRPALDLLLPGSEGQIQILRDHAPLIGTLETGLFEVHLQDGSSLSGVISSGFIQIANNDVLVMADTLELKEEIDVSRARQAQEKAENTLKEAELTEATFKKYQLKLQRALVRQNVAAGQI